jgi:hypothetical protein
LWRYPLLPLIWLAELLTLRAPDSTPDAGKGAETLCALTIARLRGSPIHVADPATIGTTLHHANLADCAADLDPRQLGSMLGVDAILYGSLTDWSGRYYLVESRTVVAATVCIRSCVDGSELFRAAISVSGGAGLSGGPTGYVSAVATPLAELGSGPYRRLAIEWSEELGQRLTGAFTGEGNLVPPPYVANVACSPAPARGYQPGDVIEVLAIGSSGCRATFDLGTLHSGIPMFESARTSRTGVPDPRAPAAFYRGSYVVGAADRVQEAPVFVTLESPGGRATAASPGRSVTIASR